MVLGKIGAVGGTAVTWQQVLSNLGWNEGDISLGYVITKYEVITLVFQLNI